MRHGDFDNNGLIDLLLDRTSNPFPLDGTLGATRILQMHDGSFVASRPTSAQLTLMRQYPTAQGVSALAVDPNVDFLIDRSIDGLQTLAGSLPKSLVVFASGVPFGDGDPVAVPGDGDYARFFSEVTEGLNDPNWFADNTTRITRPTYELISSCPFFTDGWFDQCWVFVDQSGTETVLVENFHPEAQQFVTQLENILQTGDFSNSAVNALSATFESAFGITAFGTPADGPYYAIPNENSQGRPLKELSDEQLNRHRFQVFFLSLIRTWSVDNVNPGQPHFTDDFHPVCNVGEPHCNEATVFCKLKKLPVIKRPPLLTVQTGKCNGPGANPRACSVVDVFGDPATDYDYVGPVEHTVEAADRRVTNITVEGHLLHPGEIERQVITVAGQIGIQTDGSGTGPLPGLNELFAPYIWEEATEALIELFPGSCTDDP